MSEPKTPTLKDGALYVVAGRTAAQDVATFCDHILEYASAIDAQDEENGRLNLAATPEQYCAMTGADEMPGPLTKPVLRTFGGTATAPDLQMYKINYAEHGKEVAAKNKILQALLSVFDTTGTEQLKIEGEKRQLSAWPIPELLQRVRQVFAQKHSAEVASIQARMAVGGGNDKTIAQTIVEFNSDKKYLESIDESVNNNQLCAWLTAASGGVQGNFSSAHHDFSKLAESERTLTRLAEMLVTEMYRLQSTKAMDTGFAAAVVTAPKVAEKGTGKNKPILYCWTDGPQQHHHGSDCPNPDKGHEPTASFDNPKGGRIYARSKAERLAQQKK